jgi:hypothetical protein
MLFSRAVSQISCIYKTDVSITIFVNFIRDIICLRSPRYVVYIPPQAICVARGGQWEAGGRRGLLRHVRALMMETEMVLETSAPMYIDYPRELHRALLLFLDFLKVRPE